MDLAVFPLEWAVQSGRFQDSTTCYTRRRKMKASKLLALLFAAMLPLTVACRTNETAETDDADDTATATTEQEVAGADQANDLNPVEAQTFVDDVTIGKNVVDGMIPTEAQ